MRAVTQAQYDDERVSDMSRPGFVLEVDDRTPPLLVHNGEGFLLERFPLGTRVVYPPEALPPVRDVEESIQNALLNPIDSEPLPELLRAGMRLTIAFDDISLPLPPMKKPDIRQRVIEAVLTMAADAGVDDVELISANALHRRLTPNELRDIVGERVFRSFFPDGKLYNFDAEDTANLTHLGQTKHGEDVEISKRAAESDLLVYVNVNLVAMDGGHKSTSIGLASYKSLKHHHNSHTMIHSRSFMDHKALEDAPLGLADGRGADRARQGLPDRDHAEQRHLRRSAGVPAEARVGVVDQGPGLDARHQARRSRRPRPSCGTRSSPTSGRTTA